MDISSFLAGIAVTQILVIFAILGILFKMSMEFSNFKGTVNGFIANASEKLYKIEQIGMATMQATESFVDALDNAMKDGGGANTQVFRTADGKHVAHSIEDFVKKLEADPEYQSLAHKIKEDLENAIREFDNIDDDDDDDEENSNPFK